MLDIVRRYSVGQKAKKILLLLASVAVLCAVIIVANTQAQKRKLAVSMDFIMDTVIEQKLYGKTVSRLWTKSAADFGNMSRCVRCIWRKAR